MKRFYAGAIVLLVSILAASYSKAAVQGMNCTSDESGEVCISAPENVVTKSRTKALNKKLAKKANVNDKDLPTVVAVEQAPSMLQSTDLETQASNDVTMEELVETTPGLPASKPQINSTSALDSLRAQEQLRAVDRILLNNSASLNSQRPTGVSTLNKELSK